MEIFLLHVLKLEQRNSIVHLPYNIHILPFCPLLFIIQLSKIRYTMSLSVSSHLNSELSLHFSVYWILYGKWCLFRSGDDDCIAHLYLNNRELCLFASIEMRWVSREVPSPYLWPLYQESPFITSESKCSPLFLKDFYFFSQYSLLVPETGCALLVKQLFSGS